MFDFYLLLGDQQKFCYKIRNFPPSYYWGFFPHNIPILFFPETEPWKFNLYYQLSKSKQLSMQLKFLIPGLKE